MPVEVELGLSSDSLTNGHWDDAVKFDAPKDQVSIPVLNLEPRSPQSIRSRRGSDSQTAKPVLKRFFQHSRSHTEVYGSSHHPLGSPSCSGSSFDDAGVTRPHLHRLVTGTESEDGERVESNMDVIKEDSKERVVLVHKIQPTDSLAGVALKYGIRMAELRRVNQLWSSDSIHLRKVLYIPLEKATHYRPSIRRSCSADGPRSPKASQSFEMQPIPKSPSPVLQRIPASQLSFFPPSSKPKPPKIFADEPFDAPHIPINPSRRTITPPKTLSTILTSLPIAASTRNTIIARLSFDSNSNTSVSDDQELELDDVRPSTIHYTSSKHRPRPPNPWLESESTNTEQQNWLGPSQSLPHPFATVRAPSGGISMAPMGGSHLETPPKQKIPWVQPDEVASQRPSVRTVQLEPSPSMRLPRVPRRSQHSSQQIFPPPPNDPDLW